jgi:hypothetical protein
MTGQRGRVGCRRGGPHVPLDQLGIRGEQVGGGLPSRRSVGLVVPQRRPRAELVGRLERILVDPTRIDGQLGGDVEVVDERGPARETVTTGHGQLCVVERESVRGIDECGIGSRVVPPDDLQCLRSAALIPRWSRLASSRSRSSEGLLGSVLAMTASSQRPASARSGREEVGHDH